MNRVFIDCTLKTTTGGIAEWDSTAECAGGAMYGGISYMDPTANYLFLSLFGFNMRDILYAVLPTSAAKSVMDAMPSSLQEIGFLKVCGVYVGGGNYM